MSDKERSRKCLCYSSIAELVHASGKRLSKPAYDVLEHKIREIVIKSCLAMPKHIKTLIAEDWRIK
jgi:hypothetical protein